MATYNFRQTLIAPISVMFSFISPPNGDSSIPQTLFMLQSDDHYFIVDYIDANHSLRFSSSDGAMNSSMTQSIIPSKLISSLRVQVES